MNKVTLLCPSCKHKIEGFNLPDGRFVCPNCSPQGTYSHCVKQERLRLFKKFSMEFKEKVRGKVVAVSKRMIRVIMSKEFGEKVAAAPRRILIFIISSQACWILVAMLIMTAMMFYLIPYLPSKPKPFDPRYDTPAKQQGTQRCDNCGRKCNHSLCNRCSRERVEQHESIQRTLHKYRRR